MYSPTVLVAIGAGQVRDTMILSGELGVTETILSAAVKRTHCMPRYREKYAKDHALRQTLRHIAMQ